MAKKKAKSSGSGNAHAEDTSDRKRHEQPLQGVLLADDWYATSHDLAAETKRYHYPFHPLALDLPKLLCPLLNTNLIDYAINYLASQGVQELYVVCVTGAVEQYLRSTYPNQTQHQQRNQQLAMTVTVICDATVSNAGDALRELDKRNVIQSDPFVLMQGGGDCITNADLTEPIRQHKERHTADSSAIFTMLLKTVGPTTTTTTTDADHATHYSCSHLRSAMDDLVIGIDSAQGNRILLYDDNSHSRSAKIPCSFFANHCTELEIRTDLLDVGLDLCSPDVLARFSDEFDYQCIRREFVTNSVAEEEEGLQNKLYAHILPNATYAARVTDFRTYHAIARAVLRRHVYPIVPDNPKFVPQHDGGLTLNQTNTVSATAVPTTTSLVPLQYSLQPRRNYLYYESSTDTTRVGRSSVVTGPGLLGADCWIGEHCNIHCSVMLNHCHIADHCTVRDSYVWDNVQLGVGAMVTQSILAANVIVQAGAVVSRGCVVGAGCVIGANVRLPEFTRLTMCATDHGLDHGLNQDDDWGDSSNASEDDDSYPVATTKKDSTIFETTEKQSDFISDVAIVGPDGRGRVWHPPVDDDGDEYDDDNSDEENMIPVEEILKSHCIGFNPQEFIRARLKLQQEDDDSLSADDDLDDAALDDDDGDYTDVSVTFGENPGAIGQSSTIIGRQEGVDVVKELKLICLEFETGTSPIENLAIELNSYKFSQNATYSDCTMAAMLAILDKMNIVRGMSDGKLVTEFKTHLDQWAPLLQKMSIGLDEEKAIVLALERCAVAEGGGDDDDETAVAVQERSAILSSGMSFRLLLQTLHDQEIVGEEAVLAWAADRRQQEIDGGDDAIDTPRGRLFRLPPVQEFIEWLDEGSGDDDDDDDDDDEDSE